MLLVASWMFLLGMLRLPSEVYGHARLMSPPSRSSMWRFGFPTKKNFNDNALYCGGIQIQWQRNKGKCGICGDPYDMPHPRDNEAGGKYGKGIISQRYVSGQTMETVVEVTTNHKGYFEFKLCPNNNPRKEATQECLDKYTLRGPGGPGTKYYIAGRGNGDIPVKLQLPKGLTCSQCVLQWTYVAGNNWGRCEDGTSALGCGPQETFRGCADIAIDKFPTKTTPKSKVKTRTREESHTSTRRRQWYEFDENDWTSYGLPKHPNRAPRKHRGRMGRQMVPEEDQPSTESSTEQYSYPNENPDTESQFDATDTPPRFLQSSYSLNRQRGTLPEDDEKKTNRGNKSLDKISSESPDDPNCAKHKSQKRRRPNPRNKSRRNQRTSNRKQEGSAKQSKQESGPNTKPEFEDHEPEVDNREREEPPDDEYSPEVPEQLDHTSAGIDDLHLLKLSELDKGLYRDFWNF